MKKWTWTAKNENQDAAAVGETWMTVVDGATPMRGGPSAARQASLFARALTKSVAESKPDGGNLRAVLARALRRAAAETGPKGATAAITIAAWDATTVRAISLGDVALIASLTDGSTLVWENREFTERESALEDLLVDRTQRFGAKRAQELTRVDLSVSRRLRNTEQGRWVAADIGDPDEIASHAEEWQMEKVNVKALALASDGAWAAVSPHGIETPDSFMRRLAQGDGEGLMRDTAQAERTDPKGYRNPRFSLLDDQTIAWREWV